MLLFVLSKVILPNCINSLHAILKEGLNFIVSGFVEISMKHSSRLIMQFSFCLLIFTEYRARTFKCLWGPGIDAKE